jgi:hypothetical protein
MAILSDISFQCCVALLLMALAWWLGKAYRSRK